MIDIQKAVHIKCIQTKEDFDFICHVLFIENIAEVITKCWVQMA